MGPVAGRCGASSTRSAKRRRPASWAARSVARAASASAASASASNCVHARAVCKMSNESSCMGIGSVSGAGAGGTRRATRSNRSPRSYSSMVSPSFSTSAAAARKSTSAFCNASSASLFAVCAASMAAATSWGTTRGCNSVGSSGSRRRRASVSAMR